MNCIETHKRGFRQRLNAQPQFKAFYLIYINDDAVCPSSDCPRASPALGNRGGTSVPLYYDLTYYLSMLLYLDFRYSLYCSTYTYYSLLLLRRRSTFAISDASFLCCCYSSYTWTISSTLICLLYVTFCFTLTYFSLDLFLEL